MTRLDVVLISVVLIFLFIAALFGGAVRFIFACLAVVIMVVEIANAGFGMGEEI